MKRKSFTLLVVLLLTLAGTAWAEGQIIVTPYYTYVSSIFADLAISGNTARCSGYAKGSSTETRTTLTVTLQRQAVGSSTWTTADSWGVTGTGRDLVQIERTKSVSSGYSYRVKVSCKITNAQGTQLENPIKYSDIINK